MSNIRTTPLNRDESIEGEDYRLIMDVLLGDEFDQNQFVLELVKHYPKVFVDVCETLGYVNNPYEEIASIITGNPTRTTDDYTGTGKIAAIKRYRQLTGCSIKEGKHFVDDVENDLNKKSTLRTD